MVGIVSAGAYIPKYRIRLSVIADAWQKETNDISRSLLIKEKTVAGTDEDAVTMAIEAAGNALLLTQNTVTAEDIELLLVGSESHPYAVNPTSTIVGELIGVGNHYLAADLQFACKAATAGIQLAVGFIKSKQVKYGLVIGADVAQSKPHDILEYTSAAAGGAILLGEHEVIAELIDYCSYSSDTPDFWRRDGVKYPSHAGRFTGLPAYFTHVTNAGKALLKRTNLSPNKIDYCVFHMPNGRFPLDVAKHLGFLSDQILPSLTVEEMGNPYSASSLMGLIALLEQAKPNQTIFMVSYGSGAGSDAFLWKTTNKISAFQARVTKENLRIKNQLAKKTYIGYTRYLQLTNKI